MTLFYAPAAGFAATAHSPQALRTITKAKEAHDLSAAEALRGYPIHLRVVVTYYDPTLDPRHVAIFVHDASGSIFVGLNMIPDGMAVGALVDIRGVTGMGDFAPVIAKPRVTVIGTAHLPLSAPSVSLTPSAHRR